MEVNRTVCQKCTDKRCKKCIVGMIYDCADEYMRKIYQQEADSVSTAYAEKQEQYRFAQIKKNRPYR